MDCANCKKRSTCTTLCHKAERYVDRESQKVWKRQEADAAKYVDADTVSEEEVVLGTLPSTQVFHTKLSKMESRIVTLLLEGSERPEIAETLGITRSRLRNLFASLKRKAIEF